MYTQYFVNLHIRLLNRLNLDASHACCCYICKRFGDRSALAPAVSTGHNDDFTTNLWRFANRAAGKNGFCSIEFIFQTCIASNERRPVLFLKPGGSVGGSTEGLEKRARLPRGRELFIIGRQVLELKKQRQLRERVRWQGDRRWIISRNFLSRKQLDGEELVKFGGQAEYMRKIFASETDECANCT